jgi:flagellar assembly factor FliW
MSRLQTGAIRARTASTPGVRPDAPAARLRLRSRFADVEVEARDVIAFPDGLPGYEANREFVLLELADVAPLKVLHAVNAAEPCFLVVDPKGVLATYQCSLSGADRHRLGAADDSTLLWLAIVIMDEGGEIAVNLRAPIVIDPARMTGRQVMPNACVYPLRYVVERPV